MEFDELTEAEKLLFEACQGNKVESLSETERRARWTKFHEAADRQLSSAVDHDALHGDIEVK